VSYLIDCLACPSEAGPSGGDSADECDSPAAHVAMTLSGPIIALRPLLPLKSLQTLYVYSTIFPFPHCSNTFLQALDISTVTLGTYTLTSAITNQLVVPYTLSHSETSTIGSGTFIFPFPITAATLDAKDLAVSSNYLFSSAQCTFYDSSTTVPGEGSLASCWGNVVGAAGTGGNVKLSASASCVACEYYA
jgi:hypothetical protein